MSAKKSKQEKSKLAVRIMCIILAGLMVAGVLYGLISSFAFG